MATGNERKLRVGVIFGGRSGEHEVSLVSAQSVLKMLDRQKYEIVPIGITRAGRWITAGDPMRALLSGMREDDTLPAALLADPERQAVLALAPAPQQSGESVLRATPLDVVFPVLHGPLGEDGSVQGLLELANIPYVGAGVLASALAMDKAAAKDVFAAHGFKQVRHVVIKRREWEADAQAVLQRVESEVGYDCFVKPACLGSSVGINKAHQRDELREAMEAAASFDRKIVVEAAVSEAREIEVAVLGNDEPAASIPGEIIPNREFYDYQAKYVDDRSELLIPAPISASLTARVRELALQAYLAIDCAGLARVDFLLQRGTENLYLNEINTLPGFTSISMFPKLWEASGLPYSQMLDRLIDLALERHADKNRSRTQYAPEMR